MANALETIAPKILARGMLAFRDQAFFPRLVNQGFSAEAARKGDTIDIILPGETTVSDVEPGATPQAPSDTTVKTFSLRMDNWKKVAFYLTDKELMQVDADQHFIPFQMNDAITALATEINKSFLEKVPHVANHIGVVNSNLFTDSAQHSAGDYYKAHPAIESRKLLNLAKAPRTGRFAVISYDDEARAIKLSEFADMDKSNDPSVRAEGMIGRKYGFDWFATDPVYRHISSNNKTMRIKNTFQEGATTMALSNLSEGLLVGDILTESNGNTIGIVKSVPEQVSSTEATIEMTKPSVKAYSAGTAVRTAEDHDNGVAFQRNAFAFAMRPLAAATQEYGLGNRILSVTDPATGLSLRLEISRQYKQTVWEFDALWGVDLVRPEYAVRMISGD